MNFARHLWMPIMRFRFAADVALPMRYAAVVLLSMRREGLRSLVAKSLDVTMPQVLRVQ
jgi:hypothetical protein